MVATLLVLNKDGREQRIDLDNPIPVVLATGAEDGQVLLTDDITGALAVISADQHEVHEGEAFIVDIFATAAASLVLAFKTGAKFCHMLAGFRSESKAHLEMKEAPTWNAGTGTQEKLYNRNRPGGNISTIQEDSTGAFIATEFVLKDPTNVAGGTVIHDLYTWSDKKTTSSPRDESEFILKANTQYAYVLTSDDGAKGLQIILAWYEESTN